MSGRWTMREGPDGTAGHSSPHWRCEACGELRGDADTDVLRRTVGYVQRNVVFCNDSVECGALAERIVEDWEEEWRDKDYYDDSLPEDGGGAVDPSSHRPGEEEQDD
jgi:hypothetical protein